jgi:SET domain-containing protein
VSPQVVYPGPDGPDSGELDASEYGSVARFINHSASPNCTLKRVLLNGLTRVVCCSAHCVTAGEQLTLNYGSSFWRIRKDCLKEECL